MPSIFEATSQKSAGGTGIVCELGPLTFYVDLATTGRTNRAKDVSFPMACPGGHDEPTGVKQRYLCEDETFTYRNVLDAVRDAESLDQAVACIEALEGHHSEQDDLPGYTVGELLRYRVADDGTAVYAEPDEIVAAKTGGIDAGEISFKVHQSWEVDSCTLPGKSSYRVRPTKSTKTKKVRQRDVEVYAALADMVATNPHLAIVGTLRVRDTRTTYRLGVWGGQLILTEIVMPLDLAERDKVAGDVPDAAVAELTALVEQRIEPFDPDIHYFDARAAVAELVETKRAIAAGEREAPEPRLVVVPDDEPVVDLTTMFSNLRHAA